MQASGWASAEFAAAWGEAREARNRTHAQATERMLQEARVQAGSRVLDLGTGTGDTAMLASGRVGPGGEVVATDASPAMVERAAASLRSAGVSNVVLHLMDASAIDLPAASFDAVIARHVLMFVDLSRTLAGVHMVLRPGGRFAAVVSAPLEKDAFHAIILGAVRKRGGWGQPPPELVRAFSVENPAVYEQALARAGFHHIALHTVHSARCFGSAKEAFAVVERSPLIQEVLVRLPENERAAVTSEIELALRPFDVRGSCELPLESRIVVGEA